MNRFLIVLASFAFFISCNKKQNEDSRYQEVSSISYKPDEAKELMEKHCYLCHSPNANEIEGRIAPPMVAIKAHYINQSGYSKTDFINAISEFILNPSVEQALMHGAVAKFGVMPKQVFPDSAVVKIASFMYDYKIEEPTWFKEHWQAKGNNNWIQFGEEFRGEITTKTYADIGLQYALETKTVLGKNLMGAIQMDGTEKALTFCNQQAIPLTDSMSVHFNANIKRVSDKNRNPNNKANEKELEYIEQFKKELATKKESVPVVVETDEQVYFYYPIATNTMCLQCHGNPANIEPIVLQKIKALYPNDLAIGYDENEVRGIWSIRFNKNKNE
jgi:cytochrome c553